MQISCKQIANARENYKLSQNCWRSFDGNFQLEHTKWKYLENKHFSGFNS